MGRAGSTRQRPTVLVVCAMSVPCRALMTMRWACDIRTYAVLVSFSSCTHHEFPNVLRLCHHLLGDEHYPTKSVILFSKFEGGRRAEPMITLPDAKWGSETEEKT